MAFSPFEVCAIIASAEKNSINFVWNLESNLPTRLSHQLNDSIATNLKDFSFQLVHWQI